MGKGKGYRADLVARSKGFSLAGFSFSEERCAVAGGAENRELGGDDGGG
jgi:hypothetical protein